MDPEPDENVRLANLVGAAALGIADAISEDLAGEVDLDTTAAAAIVALLDLARDASVQTLSALVGISHSGTVRLVNRLVDAGLVERRAGKDARTNSLRLTRRGRTVALRLRAGRRAAIAAALEGLTGRQQRQLSEICQTVIANITRVRLGIRTAGGQPSGGALCRLCDPAACGRPDGECPAAVAAAHEGRMQGEAARSRSNR